MTHYPQHRRVIRQDDDAMNSLSGLESFVRLQESQEEFLKWLESSEKKDPEMDRYVYKKIR
jgi:hypothetical protein